MNLAVDAARRCDIAFSIGTSALVFPAAALPSTALKSGAILVEINPQPTPLTPQAHYALAGPAGTISPSSSAPCANNPR
jgi:NAD-dependent deacetylase